MAIQFSISAISELVILLLGVVVTAKNNSRIKIPLLLIHILILILIFETSENIAGGWQTDRPMMLGRDQSVGVGTCLQSISIALANGS